MKSTKLPELLAALFLSLTMLVTSCSKQDPASNASDPANEPAKAKPFEGQIFRTADDRQAITLVSPDELEMRGGDAGPDNLICKYTRQDDTLRVVQTMLGTTLAVYYKITPDGLQANDGTVLLNPAKFLSAQARRQASNLVDSGTEKHKTREIDGAIADYNRALELDPQYVLAYNLRGVAKENKGDYERAIQDCNRSIELDGMNSHAYNNRGWAYCKKRDYDRAWADVIKCRELGGTVDEKFFAELTQASGIDLSAAEFQASFNNIFSISYAKEQWALENAKNTGDVVSLLDLVGFSDTPRCPAGGTYKLNGVGKWAECTISGHGLP